MAGGPPTTVSRNVQFALAGVLLAALIGGELAVESTLRQRSLVAERERTSEALNALRSRIEKVVYRDLLAVQALTTYIGLTHELDARAFASYARLLLDTTATLRNLAAAPDLVVRYVYPLAGNEQALGLDYRKVPEQRAAAMRAIRERSIVIAGPVPLVQGGHGFLARGPVFVQGEATPAGAPRLWGLVSAVMDRDAFYAAAEVDAVAGRFDLAIRGRDASGPAGEVFFGPAPLFDADVVTVDVNLPTGSWLLAARPRGGWLALAPPLLWPPRVATALLFVTIVTLFTLARRHQRVSALAQDAIAESAADFRSLFESANDTILLVDAATLAILNANGQAERLLGYPRQTLLTMNIRDIYVEDDTLDLAEAQRRVLESESAIFEARHRCADGRVIPVEVSSRLSRRARGDVLISVVRDISERKHIEQALQRSQRDLVNAIESMSEGFVLWDERDRIKLFNARFAELYTNLRLDVQIGVAFEDLLRKSVAHEIDLDEQEREAWIAKRLHQHRSGTSTLELVTRAGRCLRVSEHRTPEGHTVGIYTDITNLKQAEEAIRYRAYYDTLTALPNRENFMQALADTAARSRRSRTRAAILFVDLDRFKNINDTLGHETGDLVLREAARRLSAAVRQTDIVARFGGDEFTLILRDVQDANSAARIAQGIIGKLTESYKVGSHVLHTGASIGITLCPDDSTDPQVLLRNADMAMYQAKNRGRHTYQFFTARLTEMARHFVALENDLRQALRRSEFALHFQPIVRLDDGCASGAEALLRWHHPGRGIVSPAEFIPVAEETRIIVDLGAWVLREACGLGRAWCAKDGPLERIAVNVSSRQFHGGFDVEFVRRILDATGFPAECLVLEMTESLLIENDERVLATLGGLRDLGVGLAVDDFGTGYSALSYLRRFPVTTLKIDRSFIADIERTTSDAHLVESIIAMARALRITVVAEGVETAGQAEMLRGMGCSYAQGYWFGRPVTAAELGERLAEGTIGHVAAGG